MQPAAITHLLWAGALRDFGDGFIAILSPVYQTPLGFSPFDVGVIAMAALLGSALLTLGVGRRATGPGGWNRVHLIVDDLPAEVAWLRAAGVQFRNDIVIGPGGSQILLIDLSGNFGESSLLSANAKV